MTSKGKIWVALKSSDLGELLEDISKYEEDGFTTHSDSYNVYMIKGSKTIGSGMVAMPVETQITMYAILLSKNKD